MSDNIQLVQYDKKLNMAELTIGYGTWIYADFINDKGVPNDVVMDTIIDEEISSEEKKDFLENIEKEMRIINKGRFKVIGTTFCSKEFDHYHEALKHFNNESRDCEIFELTDFPMILKSKKKIRIKDEQS